MVLVFLAGKPDASGLTLFAIQPQDAAGSWQNADRRVTLDYGPITYPVILAHSSSRCSRRTGRTPATTRPRTWPRRRSAPGSRAPGELFLAVAVSADRRLHLPGRPHDAPPGPLDAVPDGARRHDPAGLEPVLLRGRRRRHLDPGVQPRPARRPAEPPASRSRWRSAASRPSPPRAGCSSRSAAMTVSRAPAGSRRSRHRYRTPANAVDRDRRRSVPVHASLAGQAIGGGPAFLIATSPASARSSCMPRTVSASTSARTTSDGRGARLEPRSLESSRSRGHRGLLDHRPDDPVFSWTDVGQHQLPVHARDRRLPRPARGLLPRCRLGRSFQGPRVMGDAAELTEIEREFDHAAGEVTA